MALRLRIQVATIRVEIIVAVIKTSSTGFANYDVQTNRVHYQGIPSTGYNFCAGPTNSRSIFQF